MKIKNQNNYKLDLNFPKSKNKIEDNFFLPIQGRTARQVCNSLKRNKIYVSISKIEAVCERLSNSDCYYTTLSDEDILDELNIS